MNDTRSFQARATRAPNPRAPILPQSSPRAPNERGAAERRPSEQTDRRRLHTAAELQRTHTATYTVQSRRDLGERNRNGNGNGEGTDREGGASGNGTGTGISSPWFAGTGSPFPHPGGSADPAEPGTLVEILYRTHVPRDPTTYRAVRVP